MNAEDYGPFDDNAEKKRSGEWETFWKEHSGELSEADWHLLVWRQKRLAYIARDTFNTDAARDHDRWAEIFTACAGTARELADLKEKQDEREKVLFNVGWVSGRDGMFNARLDPAAMALDWQAYKEARNNVAIQTTT